MESLYRKYRPLTFESVVGQQHIVSTLEHAVTEGRLSHAYLFCGPRGTGKTTMARILAKSLLCEHAEAARAQGASGCMPDGDCPECQAIAEGTHPDVYELDAASRTGVDNVREEIVNSVSFAPVRGAYKVYIIDEVHMLTTAAFNALLKTLEEPPAHVVFILCTTDPQKILETILSRCQRFDFHRISNEDLVGRMREICEQEGFAYDAEALEIVAKHARGGMRDALSTLEQLSVFGDGAVRTADARALLGEVASTVLAEFSCKIAVRDTPALFGLVRSQVDGGNDLLELTRDLVGHMRDVYTAAIAGPKPELFDGTPEEVSAFVEEARLFEGTDRLARTLTVLDDAALEMRNASDPRLVLEIALTRLARPESDLTLEALAERIARLEAQLAAGVPSGPMAAVPLAASAGGPASVARSEGAKAFAGKTAGRPVASAVSRGAEVPATGQGAAVSKASELVAPATSEATVAGTGVAASATGPNSAAAMPAGSSGSPARTSVRSGSAAAGSDAPASEKPAATVRAATAEGLQSQSHAMAGNGLEPAASHPEAARQAAATAPMSDVPAETTARKPVAGPEGRAEKGENTAAETPAPAPMRAGVPDNASTHAAAAVPVSDPGDLQRKWADVVKRVTAEQPSRGALLQSSRAQADDGDTLIVGFPAGSTFAVKMLGRPDSHAVVAPIVEAVFGRRSVEYVMDGAAPAAQTPSRPAAPQAAPGSPSTQPADVPHRSVSALRVGAPFEPASTVQVSAPAEPTSVTVSEAQFIAAAPTPQAAPVQQHGPVQPGSTPQHLAVEVSGRPAVDQVSGPTIVPEPDVDAQRKAWEDEQVPYDDATIAAYTDDEEIPPFDIPAASDAAEAAPASASQAAAKAAPAPPSDSANVSAVPASPIPSCPSQSQVPAPTPHAGAVPSAHPAAAPQPAAKSDSPVSSQPVAADAAPWESASPFGHPAEAPRTPETEEEAKAMLGDIFGSGIVFKDA